MDECPLQIIAILLSIVSICDQLLRRLPFIAVEPLGHYGVLRRESDIYEATRSRLPIYDVLTLHEEQHIETRSLELVRWPNRVAVFGEGACLEARLLEERFGPANQWKQVMVGVDV